MKKTILSTMIATAVLALSQTGMAMDVAKANLVKPMPKQVQNKAPSNSSVTANAKFYIDVQAGLAKNDFSKKLPQNGVANILVPRADDASINTKSSSKAMQLAEQINFGYMLNKYFGVEVGYTHYAKNNVKANFYGFSQNQGTVNYKIKQQGIDLAGLAQYPITESFAVYGKFGVQYLMTAADMTADYGNGNPVTVKFKKNTIAPMAALGVSYTLPSMPQLSFNAQYQEVFANKTLKATSASQGVDKSQFKIKQPNIGIASVGVKYAF